MKKHEMDIVKWFFDMQENEFIELNKSFKKLKHAIMITYLTFSNLAIQTQDIS